MKDYIKVVRSNGGISVLINLEAVAKSWEEEFDYHVVGKCEEVTVEMERLWKIRRKGRREEGRRTKKEKRRVKRELRGSNGDRVEEDSLREREKAMRKARREERRVEKRRKAGLVIESNRTRPGTPEFETAPTSPEEQQQEEEEEMPSQEPDPCLHLDDQPLPIPVSPPTPPLQIPPIRPEENLSETLPSSISLVISPALLLPTTKNYSAELIARLVNLLPPSTLLITEASTGIDAALERKRKHSTLSSSSTSIVSTLPIEVAATAIKRQRLFPPHFLPPCGASTSTSPPSPSPSFQEDTSYPYPLSTSPVSSPPPRKIRRISRLQKLQLELGKDHLAAFLARTEHARWVYEGVGWWGRNSRGRGLDLELEEGGRGMMINSELEEGEGKGRGDEEAKEEEDEEEGEEERESRELDKEDELARARLADYRRYSKRVLELQEEVDLRVKKERRAKERKTRMLTMERERVLQGVEEGSR